MVTFAEEAFSDIKTELPPLFLCHYNEIAEDREIVPLCPDWGKYEALEKRGELHIVTARDDKRLVGYYFFVVSTGLHYARTVFSVEDIYYLLPEYRVGLNGLSLLKKGEDVMRVLGVTKAFISTKLSKDCGILFKRMGYRPVETLYCKVLV